MGNIRLGVTCELLFSKREAVLDVSAVRRRQPDRETLSAVVDQDRSMRLLADEFSEQIARALQCTIQVPAVYLCVEKISNESH